MAWVLEILCAYELEECHALVRDDLRERQGARRERIRLFEVFERDESKREGKEDAPFDRWEVTLYTHKESQGNCTYSRAACPRINLK